MLYIYIIKLLIFLYIDAFKEFHPLPQALNTALAGLLKSIEYIPENIIFDFITIQRDVPPQLNLKVDGRIETPLDCLTSLLLSDNLYIQLATHLLLIK